MENKFQGNDVQDIFSGLDEKVDAIYKHQSLMMVYQKLPRDYDLGYFMSEVEAHALNYIRREPGMTAKRLGEIMYRTKGTISTLLSQLEKGGFIEQKTNSENLREHQIYLTEKGEEVCVKHTAYDRRTTSNYLSSIAEHCTAEEINGFFKVTHYRCEWLEQTIARERKYYNDVKNKERAKISNSGSSYIKDPSSK